MTTRILAVDDDEAGLYVLSRILRSQGFEVIEASRGQEAIDLAAATHPDLVVLDVNLPDVSGYDVCQAIREHGEHTHVPVLMLSATSITGEDRVRGLTRGADAYLTEPVETDELVAVINALLRMRRAERSVVELNRSLNAKVQELETIIDTLPIGLAIADDPQCRQVRRNAAMAELTGTEGGRDITVDAGELPHFVMRQEGVEVPAGNLPLRRAARGEVVRDQEHEIVRADGTSVFVYGHASPLYDADGKVSGSVAAFMDLTERKAAEARQRVLADMTGLLAESLDIERTLEGTAGLAVRHLSDWCLIDIVQSDGELRRVTAAHRDPNMQALVRRLCDIPIPASGLQVIQDALESGKPTLVSRFLDDDWLKYENSPLFTELLHSLGIASFISAPLAARGRSLGVMSLVRSSGRGFEEADVAVAVDLASRAALALDNAILFKAVEEASRAKDTFFAMVSHELRTPLTSIIGWATMLTNPEIDPSLRQLGVSEINRSATTQARIIEDLLDSVRISAGKIQLELSEVTLDAVVDEAVALIQQSVADKELELSVTHDRRAVVTGDRHRLVQIASNLLTNAVKFTPKSGSIHVEVSAAGADGMAELIVRDSGRGISPRFLPHVFEQFTQQEDDSGGVGMGLGLNIVKSFVELHGGSVSVRSEGEGAGSEFTVRLPAGARR
jgi:PAS domain S-box-containing protein